MADEESSLREDIEAAVQQHEEAPEGVEPARPEAAAPEEAPAPEPTPPAEEPASPAAPAGAEPDSVDAPAASAAPTSDAPAEPAGEGEAPGAAGSQEAVADSGPPAHWNPQAREMWRHVPRAVKEQLASESERANEQSEAATQAQAFHQQFTEVMRPYEAMTRADGRHPLEVAGQMLQTEYLLRNSGPQEQARLIHQVIEEYSRDPNSRQELVRVLDSLLAGEEPPNGQSVPAPVYQDPAAQQALAQVNQLLQGLDMAAEQQRYAAETAFATAKDAQGNLTHEFFADVKGEMDSILYAAEKSGSALTLDEAYNRAIWANPHTSAVLRQRAEAAVQRQGSTPPVSAAGAASSVSSSAPGNAPPVDPSKRSMRDDIRAAIEQHAGSTPV